MQQPLRVVLLQSDLGVTQSLIAPLRNFFLSVRAARSCHDLRAELAESGTEVAILDLEMASLSEVARLCHDFPAISIVCNHRLADEEMWAATLNAGAADCCPSHDTRDIVRAALRHAPPAHSLAA
jgi:DNA-binding NarL/FixJ family response regulator